MDRKILRKLTEGKDRYDRSTCPRIESHGSKFMIDGVCEKCEE